ncbi:MAG: carboxypeptidase regulatory-like domain-containing protein, partial [Candidatus Tyrphobacter sp.]
MGRVLRAAVLVGLLAASAVPALAQGSGVRGVVVDDTGRTIAGARLVFLPSRRETTTDARGSFSIALPAGRYTAVAFRPGYNSVTVAGILVRSDEQTAIVVRMPAVALSSLLAIARVETVSPGVFNAGSYPVSVLGSQQFIDAGAITIEQILNETPGIVAARPNANAAALGSTVSPNLRGALDYEKETLVDGHPLINGSHGDYPVMLIDSMLFDDIEIAKGPSAYASEIYYGIGGTMNFRTGDPTLVPATRVLYGIDNQDGIFANIRSTGTQGRLGWVFDLASYGTQGPLRNYGSEFAVSKGTTLDGYGKISGTTTGGSPLNGQTGPYPTRFSLGDPTNAYSTLVACCQYVTSNYLTKGEVAKLYYHLSSSTVVDAGFVGVQGLYDGAAGSFGEFDTTFAPSAAYVAPGAPFQPGAQIPIAEKTTFPDSNLYDSEPMFEADVRSTVGDDTIFARYYSEVYARQTASDL